MERTSNNVTKFDTINAQNSFAFRDLAAGEILNVRAAGVLEDAETKKEFSYIWTEQGECYAGNSKSVRDSIDDIIDLIDSGEKIDAEIVSRQSKQGQTFLSIRVFPRA